MVKFMTSTICAVTLVLISLQHHTVFNEQEEGSKVRALVTGGKWLSWERTGSQST